MSSVDKLTFASRRIWVYLFLKLAGVSTLGGIGYWVLTFTLWCVCQRSDASPALQYWASGSAEALWLLLIGFSLVSVLEEFNRDVAAHQAKQRKETYADGPWHD